jgi:hypothetical protein
MHRKSEEITVAERQQVNSMGRNERGGGGGWEDNAEEGFKGKIEEATAEETVKGAEETAEETSDGGKATLIEDPKKRMRKRRRRRPSE